MTEREPPLGGWTIAEAAAGLLPDLYSEAAALPPKDWWMVGGTYRREKRDALRLEFRRLMEGGAYIAQGVLQGELQPRPITPSYWRSANFALGLPGETDAAEFVVGMHKWTGLRVLPSDCVQPPWPAVSSAPKDKAAPGHLLSDLPEWWTLNQAIYWISLRDTAEVLKAGSPASWRDAAGVAGLDLEWALRKQKGTVLGPMPYDAESALVAAARRGGVRGEGTPHTAAEPREIKSTHWAHVTIAPDPQGNGSKYLCPEGFDGFHWRGVLLKRDDLLRQWPAFAACGALASIEDGTSGDGASSCARDEKASASADGAPSASGNLKPVETAAGEYVIRVARWKLARRDTPNLRDPSPADDKAWADAMFGGLSRRTLRALRVKHGPDSWRLPGKRTGPIWRD